MGKGSNTTTQSKTYTPAAMGAYQSVLNRAGEVAGTPYQAYGGELTAGINPYQQQAFGAINQAAGFASPYISEAAGLARGAAGPITDADIGRYTDPYTQRVVDAYRRQQETQNAREQSSLVGNAAAKGALGGDRVSVAQSSLAGEHARAQDPIIAGLYSQGYGQALGAAQAERARQGQSAGQLAGFGVSGAQAGLAGANAMLGAGTLQQTTEQQRLQALYGQYQMAQAYPYQQAQWLAGITGSMGSQMGGTTSGEMTKPPPDPWAQYIGAGLTAGSMMMSDARAKSDIEQIGTSNDGLPIYRFKYSGDPSGKTQIGLMAQDVERVKPEAVAEFGGLKHIDPEAATEDAARTPRAGFAAGGGMPGMPWGGAQGWIPLVQGLTMGKTEPDLDKWPETKDQSSFDPSKLGQLAGDFGKKASDKFGGLGGTLGSAGQDYSLTGTGGTWARGGGVWLPGEYALGGPPDGPAPFDERYATDADYAPPTGVPSWAHGALGDAVRGFAKQHKPLISGDWPEAYENREPRPALWPKDVPDAAPSPPPSAVAGMAPPRPLAGRTEDALPVGLPPAPGRPPVMASDEEPYRPPSDYPAPTAFRPSGEGAPDAPRSGFGLLGKLDPALGQSLMAAGLGMMASRSPHLGVAIGEGGLTGMSAYAGVKAAERAQEEQKLTRAQAQQKIDQAAKGLDETARHHRETLAETVRHRKMLEAKPDIIHEEKDRYGTVIRQIKGVRDPSGGYRIINPDGSLGPLAQPGQFSPPASTGTPNTTRIAKSEEADGIIPRNAMLVSSGPYDYSMNAPQMEKGFDVPEPQAVGDASSAAIKTGASRYLLDGTLPRIPFGNSSVAKAQRAYVMSIQNYANAMAESRGISHDDLAELQRNAKGYIGFVTGQNGRTVVALGTAVQHLDTMRQLAKAWKEGQWGPDVPAFNAMRSFVSRQFGANAATDLQTAASIVGPEIIKAIGVAGAGTHAERLAQEAFMSPRVSADQMEGSIKALEKLLGGQLKTKKGQAEALGVDESRFKKLVGDRPFQVLMSAESDHGAGTKGAPAGSLSENDQKALDWAKGNPTDPRAGAIKKRLGAE